jgi:MarR family transcriptional regulator, organic hydroperoxide resistance regulator
MTPRRPAANDAGQADDWLQLDRQLCFALYSTSLAMTKLYKPLLAPLGLTYPQYLALLALWERDGATVSELGGRLHLDSGTLTPLLKRLEAAGLVTRSRAADDERRVLVHLTPGGRELRKKARCIPEQLNRNADTPLNEIGALTQQLQQLRARLLARDADTAEATGT